MTSSHASFSLSEMPPLPPSPPPQPPSSSTNAYMAQMPAFNPANYMSQTPQALMNPAANSLYYQQYYQQYYQYMYGQQAASYGMLPSNVTTAAATAAASGASSSLTQSYSNYNQQQTHQKQQQSGQATGLSPNKTGPIKFNLKFQQPVAQAKSESNEINHEITETTPASATVAGPRKSRFNNLNNVTAQQKAFELNAQNKPANVSAPVSTATTVSPPVAASATPEKQQPQSEIVFDIHKWPNSLKTFCAKVYQHYQSILLVTEDQVTKYLQQRITDAFKIKSNLEIGWETEALPTVEQIKQVAPLSNAQQQQLKQQASINQKKLNAAKAAAQQIQFKKQQQQPNAFNYHILNANKNKIADTASTPATTTPPKKEKRKKNRRSSSSSSTSTSRSRSSSRSTSSKSTPSSKNGSSPRDSDEYGKKKSDEFSLAGGSNGSIYKNKFNNKRKLVPFEVSSTNTTSTMTPNKFNKQVSSQGEGGSMNLDQNGGQFINNYSNFTNGNGQKLTKKQRKNQAKLSKRMQLQQQQQQRFLNTNLNNNNDKILLSRKFNETPAPQYVKVNKSKASFKSTLSLLRDNLDAMDIDEENLEHKKIWCLGTNPDLEKEYLRLTGPPEPSMIRPLSVLKRSLEYILNKYNRTKDYRYICDQLKAIRQDLTVQVIKNEFTIQVYETHARIAIENKDRDEFNQCQNQLKNLYNLVLKPLVTSSSSSNLLQETTNISKLQTSNAEFIGYRLIYNMLTKSYKDLNEVTKEIKTLYSSNAYLKHLLELKNAWHLNNFVKFFRLYTLSNHLTRCLIDLFIERERKNALKIIIKAYRPSIKLESVREMLAYESLEKCKEDLLAYKLIIQTVSNSSSSSSSSSNVGSSSEAKTASSTSSNFNSTTSSHTKSTSSIKIQPSSPPQAMPEFELILDCKSCSIQNL